MIYFLSSKNSMCAVNLLEKVTRSLLKTRMWKNKTKMSCYLYPFTLVHFILSIAFFIKLNVWSDDFA